MIFSVLFQPRDHSGFSMYIIIYIFIDFNANIAEFFGIGVDELLGTKKEPVPEYDPTTAALVEAFSKMNDEQRRKLMAIVSQM